MQFSLVGIKPIDEGIRQYITDGKIFVLRDVSSGNALNVSYSLEGLYWSTNASGKLIFFRNAQLMKVYGKDALPTNVRIVGDTRLSDKVYVERFVPTNRPTLRGQIAEYTWTRKAQALLSQNS